MKTFIIAFSFALFVELFVAPATVPIHFLRFDILVLGLADVIILTCIAVTGSCIGVAAGRTFSAKFRSKKLELFFSTAISGITAYVIFWMLVSITSLS